MPYIFFYHGMNRQGGLRVGALSAGVQSLAKSLQWLIGSDGYSVKQALTEQSDDWLAWSQNNESE